MSIEVKPIAYLRSPWKEKFGVPRQPGLVPEAWGEIEFMKEYADPQAREGLEGFSHLWITFLFDQVAEEETRLRVRPPRLGGNEKVGVFATRSPFRPNRLGLSVCKIASVFPKLVVKGVDVVDGTPILDLRPYLPYVDAIPQAQAGFAVGPPARIDVEVAPDLATQWQELPDRERKLIKGMVSLQPGPAYQVDFERIYHAKVAGREVHWKVGPDAAMVVKL